MRPDDTDTNFPALKSMPPDFIESMLEKEKDYWLEKLSGPTERQRKPASLAGSTDSAARAENSGAKAIINK
jgi:hypothetical protein